jgi:hypothetical protein
MSIRGLKHPAFYWVLFVALSSAPLKANADESTGAAWPSKMRGIEKVFQELLIDLNSDERFNSPKNFKKIEQNAARLAKLAHSLKSKEVQSPDLDPSIQLIASLFAEEADHAYLTLTSGYRPYARKTLRAMTTYCVACHTRSNSGPSFQFISSNQTTPLIESLKNVEKADYFASVRQFDRALAEYDQIIQDVKYSAENPFEWEKAVRSALAISVRVKKDPNHALAIINHALATPKIPYFLKDQAAQWKQSLEAWKSEKSVKLTSENEYYAEASRLVVAAKAKQKFPADRSADIIYLRASSAVHDLLGFAPNGKLAADGLYLAGLCYEVLDNMNLNEMNEFYYLSCILKAPHSERSRECFRSYESSVYFGYTGSSGTHLPEKVRERLDRLDLMSNPLDAKITHRPTLE